MMLPSHSLQLGLCWYVAPVCIIRCGYWATLYSTTSAHYTDHSCLVLLNRQHLSAADGGLLVKVISQRREVPQVCEAFAQRLQSVSSSAGVAALPDPSGTSQTWRPL